MNKEPIQLKVLLKGDSAKRFMFIKEKLGLETNAEVVRYLIMKEYEKIEARSE